MPYKDKEEAQKYWREKKRQQRMSNPGGNVQPYVQPIALTRDVTVSVEKAAKLWMICNGLDREIRGLAGRENMLDLVSYGVNGPAMREVRAKLV